MRTFIVTFLINIDRYTKVYQLLHPMGFVCVTEEGAEKFTNQPLKEMKFSKMIILAENEKEAEDKAKKYIHEKINSTHYYEIAEFYNSVQIEELTPDKTMFFFEDSDIITYPQFVMRSLKEYETCTQE